MQKYSKLIASFLIAALILSSILAFPGSALSLSPTMAADKSSYVLGELVTFTPTIDFSEGELRDIDEVSLVIAGPQPFSVNLPVAQGTYTNITGLVSVVVEWQNIVAGYGYGYGYGYKAIGTPAKIKYTIKMKAPIFLDPAPADHPADLPATTFAFNYPTVAGATTDPLGMASDGTYLWILLDGASPDKIVKVDPANPGTALLSFDAPSDDTGGLTWLGSNLWVASNETVLGDPVVVTDTGTAFGGEWGWQVASVPQYQGVDTQFQDVNGDGFINCDDILDIKLNGVSQPGGCLSVDGPNGAVFTTFVADFGDEIKIQYGYQELLMEPGAIKLDPADGTALASCDTPAGWGGVPEDIDGLASDGTNLYMASGLSNTIYKVKASDCSLQDTLYPWADWPQMPPGDWNALTYYSASLYGASGEKVYKINPSTDKISNIYTTTLVDGIQGLDTQNDEMFLAEPGGSSVYTAGIPGAPAVEKTALGDYTAKLRVKADGQTFDSAGKDYSLTKIGEVVVTITDPQDGDAFFTKTVVIEGTVNDPSVTEVTIFVDLPTTTLFSDDMESGEGTWTKGGLWNLFDNEPESSSPPHVWRYADKDTGNYDTGAPNAGSLTSEAIAIGSSTTLSFYTRWDTEPGRNFDKKIIQVGSGGSWTNLAIIDDLDPTKAGPPLQPGQPSVVYTLTELQAQLDALEAKQPNLTFEEWMIYTNLQGAVADLQGQNIQMLAVVPKFAYTLVELSLNGFSGQTKQIRFSFDTVDAIANYFFGWAIDDVLVAGAGRKEKTVATAGDPTFSTTFDLEEGSNTIKVEATSPYAPFLMGEDEVTVSVDSTAPIVTLDPLPDFTNNPSLSISGTVNELNPDVLEVTVNGKLVLIDKALTAGESTFSKIITISQGLNTIVATVTDAAGLQGSATDTVSLDVVGPDIAVLATKYPVGEVSARPEKSQDEPGDIIVFQVDVSDVDSGVASVKMVMPNGQEADFMTVGDQAGQLPEALQDQWGTTGQYLFPFRLPVAPSGTYTLTVKATDQGGNVSTKAITAKVVDTLEAFNVYLLPEWNLWSTPLIPTNTSISALTAGLAAKGLEVIWYYDASVGEWFVYTPPGSPQDGPDDLLTVGTGKGYWAFMDKADFKYSKELAPGLPQTPAPVKMTIAGQFLKPGKEVPPTYNVYQGWNLIGLHAERPVKVSTYLGSLIGVGHGQPIWGSLQQYLNYIKFEPDQAPEIFLGVFDRLLSTDDMEPGRGNWLFMIDDGTIAP